MNWGNVAEEHLLIAAFFPWLILQVPIGSTRSDEVADDSKFVCSCTQSDLVAPGAAPLHFGQPSVEFSISVKVNAVSTLIFLDVLAGLFPYFIVFGLCAPQLVGNAAKLAVSIAFGLDALHAASAQALIQELFAGFNGLRMLPPLA